MIWVYPACRFANICTLTNTDSVMVHFSVSSHLVIHFTNIFSFFFVRSHAVRVWRCANLWLAIRLQYSAVIYCTYCIVFPFLLIYFQWYTPCWWGYAFPCVSARCVCAGVLCVCATCVCRIISKEANSLVDRNSNGLKVEPLAAVMQVKPHKPHQSQQQNNEAELLNGVMPASVRLLLLPRQRQAELGRQHAQGESGSIRQSWGTWSRCSWWWSDGMKKHNSFFINMWEYVVSAIYYNCYISVKCAIKGLKKYMYMESKYIYSVRGEENEYF